MRLVAGMSMLVVLAVGITFGYLMYRQLGDGTVALEATPEFKMTESGARCGEVDLVVAARTLGRWDVVLGDGQNVSGWVAVNGGDEVDIGFRVWSPSNRLVFFAPERAHRQEFELLSTIRGAYGFEFDNRHSSFTDKRVTVSLCLA